MRQNAGKNEKGVRTLYLLINNGDVEAAVGNAGHGGPARLRCRGMRNGSYDTTSAKSHSPAQTVANRKELDNPDSAQQTYNENVCLAGITAIWQPSKTGSFNQSRVAARNQFLNQNGQL